MATPPFRLLLAALAAGCTPLAAQRLPEFEQAPTRYSASEPDDAVARLRARIEASLPPIAAGEREVLRAVLAALEVPASSQVVVFSKTSLQRRRIRPSSPRALYFSDTVYVGWVPRGLIEIAAVDARLGPVFYAFDPLAAGEGARTFKRDADCLDCHGDHFVRDIPALFVRSVVPDAAGEPLLRHGTKLVDDRTPFAERWGGWYVTGYEGPEDHRGNAWATESGDTLSFPLSARRPGELADFFDTSRYPEPTSDVVALLVMEHQMAMQNSLTLAGQRCRKMLAYQASLQKGFNQPVTEEPAYDSVKSVFASATEDVLDHLLFKDAAPLPAGVTGSPAFHEAFVANAQRDADGRSLKDLHLQGRLFANRCSYLIHSDTFAALPDPLRARILDRLHAVLRGDAPDPRYHHLEADERARIYRLLHATLPEARVRWTALEAAEPR